MNDGGCYGSVLVDDELWASLRALNGHDVPWVHGCVLDHGHDGDHGAPVGGPVDGEALHWLRWSGSGTARLDRVDPEPPGRHSRSGAEGADGVPPRSPAVSGGLVRPPTGVGSPASGSQADALWAIAAALERLGDMLGAYLASLPRENGAD